MRDAVKYRIHSIFAADMSGYGDRFKRHAWVYGLWLVASHVLLALSVLGVVAASFVVPGTAWDTVRRCTGPQQAVHVSIGFSLLIGCFLVSLVWRIAHGMRRRVIVPEFVAACLGCLLLLSFIWLAELGCFENYR